MIHGALKHGLCRQVDPVPAFEFQMGNHWVRFFLSFDSLYVKKSFLCENLWILELYFCIFSRDVTVLESIWLESPILSNWMRFAWWVTKSIGKISYCDTQAFCIDEVENFKGIKLENSEFIWIGFWGWHIRLELFFLGTVWKFHNFMFMQIS